MPAQNGQQQHVNMVTKEEILPIHEYLHKIDANNTITYTELM